MAFELVVEIPEMIVDLGVRWQTEINSRGFSVEACPGFTPSSHEGFLPFKVSSLPEKYLFGLPQVIQISGFEVDFTDVSAHFRSAMGRPIAELIMMCYGAATLAVITGGTYHDPQTGESFDGDEAIAQADREIRAYEPYIDDSARTQHAFGQWADYQ